MGLATALQHGGPPGGKPPVASEGHKTIAFEIAEALGWQAPDAVIVPVAYGDALAGIQRGFHELHEMGLCEREPRLIAAEAFGSLMQALADGDESPVATGGSGFPRLLGSCSAEHLPGARRSSRHERPRRGR